MDSSKDTSTTSSSGSDSLNLSLTNEEKLAILVQKEIRQQQELEEGRGQGHKKAKASSSSPMTFEKRNQLVRWMSDTCNDPTILLSSSKSPYLLLTLSVQILDSFTAMYDDDPTSSKLPINLQPLAGACIVLAAKSRKIRIDENVIIAQLSSEATPRNQGELKVSLPS